MARALGLLAVTSVYAFTHDESAACYASRYPKLRARFCTTDRCDTHALHDHYKIVGATEKRLWGCRGAVADVSAHNPFDAPRAAHVRPAAAPGNPVAYRTAARAGRGRVEQDDVSVRSYLRGSRLVSTTPYLSNDVYWELAEQVNIRATGPPPIIFVPEAGHGLTEAWLRKLLGRRTAPFVLVTTHNGAPHDTPRRRGDALDVLLKDPRVVRVYAKNALYSSEKLRPLPLGTKWQYTSRKFFGEPEKRLLLKEALEAAGAGSAEKTRALFETSSRPLKILVGYVSSTHSHRRGHAEALRTSPAASIITTARKKSFRGYLEDLRAAAFVFSPPGAGRDCHRHWEALLMGAVPIVVQDNTNAKLFEGLPVWRVKSYGNISYEEVEKQHARFHGPGTNWDFGRLYTDFWLREFTNAADEIKNSSRSRRNSADAREEAAGLGGGLWPGAGAV